MSAVTNRVQSSPYLAQIIFRQTQTDFLLSKLFVRYSLLNVPANLPNIKWSHISANRWSIDIKLSVSASDHDILDIVTSSVRSNYALLGCFALAAVFTSLFLLFFLPYRDIWRVLLLCHFQNPLFCYKLFLLNILYDLLCRMKRCYLYHSCVYVTLTTILSSPNKHALKLYWPLTGNYCYCFSFCKYF